MPAQARRSLNRSAPRRTACRACCAGPFDQFSGGPAFRVPAAEIGICGRHEGAGEKCVAAGAGLRREFRDDDDVVAWSIWFDISRPTRSGIEATRVATLFRSSASRAGNRNRSRAAKQRVGECRISRAGTRNREFVSAVSARR